MYKSFGISDKIINYVNDCEKKVSVFFDDLEYINEFNTLKVLNAFRNNNLSETHLFSTTGYGYNDAGRDIIEKIYANIFNTEDALVRQQIVSGTHALSIALFALLKYGDEVISITGSPYDTFHRVIGIIPKEGSLIDSGVIYKQVELKNDKFDLDSIKKIITNKTKVVMIQRSRGYSCRNSLSINDIKEVTDFIKKFNKNIIILVDNCYGEFTDIKEPTDFSADILIGSLIKNLGAGLAISGGYIVGKKDLIEKCSYRLTTPATGKEIGISFNQNRNVLEGLFFAPMVVTNALKGGKLLSYIFNDLGYEVSPKYSDKQNDIVTCIKMKDEKEIIDFCNAIQNSSCVDSFVRPVPSDMVGYDDKVIMASGSFVSGSSIELSCDAPIRQPYLVFFQGGLSYYQIKFSIMNVLKELKLF